MCTVRHDTPAKDKLRLVVITRVSTNPAEADTLRQMREWADESIGVREIARRLNAAGIPSKRGGRWHPTTVARLVDPEARAYARRQSASARTADREQSRRARADRVLGRLARGTAG